MAVTVDDAFKQFHATINLSGDHRATANARKDWIVSRLRPTFTIVDAFAFGSIPKFTALSGHADADVLVVLHYGKHLKDRQPATVLSNVKTALGNVSSSVRRNGQAITVKFNSWPNVDVVPAAVIYTDDGKVNRYDIPDMHQGIWLPTRPRKHANEINAAASERGPVFRQVIKMAKDWSRRQAVRLQSYHIEVIALRHVSGDSYPWAMLEWFKGANELLNWCWHEGHDITDYLAYDQRQKLGGPLRAAESSARSAWYLTCGMNANHREAIRIWKSIFGQRFPGYG